MSQFRRGQSGNPRGRPSGVGRGIQAKYLQELIRVVPIDRWGRICDLAAVDAESVTFSHRISGRAFLGKMLVPPDPTAVESGSLSLEEIEDGMARLEEARKTVIEMLQMMRQIKSGPSPDNGS